MPVTGGAGKAGGGSSRSGSGGGGSDTIVKKRDLMTKAEKLVLLRNALFLENGGERDVTEVLAPAFKTFAKNGVNAAIEFTHGEALVGDELNDLLTLAEEFAEAAEVEAGREYVAEDKEEHLTEDAARFLIAREIVPEGTAEEEEGEEASGSSVSFSLGGGGGGGKAKGKLLGFAHFRFTLHGELADVMEGLPCLFVYDVHVVPEARRKGLGKHLMTMLELIGRRAGVSEMVVACPTPPRRAPPPPSSSTGSSTGPWTTSPPSPKVIGCSRSVYVRGGSGKEGRMGSRRRGSRKSGWVE